jgi:hypothetical protein
MTQENQTETLERAAEKSRLEKELNALGRVYAGEPDEFYTGFVNEAVASAEPFFQRNVHVFGGTNRESRGRVVAAVAEFPSGHKHPIYEYLVEAGGYSAPIDARCAYTLLCDIVRTGGIPDSAIVFDEKSKSIKGGYRASFAQRILDEMDDKGFLEEVQILYEGDVRFARELLKDALSRPTSENSVVLHF